MLLGVLLLGSCCICQAAFAQSNEDCAKPPSSPLVLNVRDKGARGDGSSDDTVSIQAAIDEIAGTHGTVLVPDGTYLVNAAGKRSTHSQE